MSARPLPGRLPRLLGAATVAIAVLGGAAAATAQAPPPTPPARRGSIQSERAGFHDAANIRTVFYNFGMVGDYPNDPLKVDLSVFHSVEVPKGSGMNYSDGITPFVLTNLPSAGGGFFHIMETGYRERQAISIFTNRQMRFEPRPGFFEQSALRNVGRSPAISSDSTTWPARWPDREVDGTLPDSTDPGWPHAWDGYFGKRPAADQESFTVMDDQAYDSFLSYNADPRDPTRRGLGLRVEVRGFQWSNPQAGNVIFWHYDIANETPTDYVDNIIFGLYMDSGVGGSAVSCDGVAESDDDNAYWDRSARLNLVYTWDKYGHGVDLSGTCGRTGYLGYAYLETPGNDTNGIDDDRDGIIDESRTSGPGIRITGQDSIMAYICHSARYDTAAFQATYGPITERPAYNAGVWWTGDEDMDWRIDLDDVGEDGVPNTHDKGEGDGIPTDGEPNFDRTDLHESDQIGLTGFKMNRIRAGVGNPDQTIDDILFYANSQKDWPDLLWQHFTAVNPAARFDSALAANYNIAFLFASGPFRLYAGKRERFSLALAYGADLSELRETVQTVQLIYNANYQFAVPPPQPTVYAETGDHYVKLSWDDVAERGIDPVTGIYDFEGYKIYRSTDPDFRDPRVLTTGRGTPFPSNGKPIAQFDLIDGKQGYTRKTIDGVAYWLGTDSGITHTWTDSSVTNGQDYFYAVCAYDFGFDAPADSAAIYPSENPITVTRTPRGSLHLPGNVVEVRPDPRAPGFQTAATHQLTHPLGDGTGAVDVRVVGADSVRSNHLYKIGFTAPSPESVLATAYTLTDSSDHRVLFTTGTDFDGSGIGPVGDGLLPVISTRSTIAVDSVDSGFRPGAVTNTRIFSSYQTTNVSINKRRRGYPNDVYVVFDSAYVDTALALGIGFPAKRAKFRIFARANPSELRPEFPADTTDFRLKFRFRDLDNSGTLNRADEWIDILCYDTPTPTTQDITWRVQLDTLGQYKRGPIVAPSFGDVYDLKVHRPLSAQDVYLFRTQSAAVNPAAAAAAPEKPYVVPNPYVGSASFEPARFATSGRGLRRIEFRAIPQSAVIRIYTVHGDLVQTLRQGEGGPTTGWVSWDLRTKDNLEAAPGLYIFHVESPGRPAYVGKFAIVK